MERSNYKYFQDGQLTVGCCSSLTHFSPLLIAA